MMKFLSLKAKAQKELGNKYDVRKFHDAILEEGAIPLNELDLLVEDYIQSESNKR